MRLNGRENDMPEKLTAKIAIEYQHRRCQAKTIGEFKTLGRELVDRFGLSDRDAIDLLNGHDALEILYKYEQEVSAHDR